MTTTLNEPKTEEMNELALLYGEHSMGLARETTR